MAETRLRLGEMLVEAGVLGQDQLESALELQKKRGLRIGQILLQEGFISEPQLVQALSRRLSLPWVSLRHVDIPDELLELVPINLAEEFFLIPVYFRTSPTGERTLFVAMNDPTDDNALRFVAASAGMPVKPMVAGPSDIAAAIRVYYYNEEDIERDPTEYQMRGSVPPPKPSVPPPRTSSVPPPRSSSVPPPARARASSPPGSGPKTISADEIERFFSKSAPPEPPYQTDDTEPEESAEERASDKAEKEQRPVEPSKEEVERAKEEAKKQRLQREVEKHMFGVGGSKRTRGVSLTLLDGTTISFGGAQKKAVDDFTKEDLLAGLRAAASGTPMDDFLPSDRGEDYIAAILEILLRKNLIFFDEIMKVLDRKKS